MKTFEDLPGIEGVEIAPDVKKAYTSNWLENKIGVIDLDQMKVIKKIPTESKPDGIAYAPPFHKIYVSDERARAEAVVDTAKDEIITTLHFASETGNPRYDPVSRQVYVNLQDKNVIEGTRLVINTMTNHSQIYSTDEGRSNGRVRGVFYPNQKAGQGGAAQTQPAQPAKR